jgi:subtilisin family serine protease
VPVSAGRSARPLLLALLAVLLHVTSGACSAEPSPPPRVVASRAALDEARALIGLDVVASRGFDGAGITVAVIDSGIDTSHPDLAGRVVGEACFCSTGASGCCPGATSSALGPGSAADDHGHGTHVAGILASQGATSPRGGAPGVRLVAVKVLSSALGFCCMQDLVDALDWVASAHPEVDVINLSLGTTSLYASDCDVLYSALGARLDALRANGVLVVAASGNDRSSTQLPSPACMASVLSAGAVWDADVGPQSTYCTELGTAPDQVACYSNASGSLDLLAPGGAIESTWPGGGTRIRIGTSHAAPLVSACAATLLQADPSLDADSLATLLTTTGKPVTDARSGRSYPRVDCAAALAQRVPLPPEPDAGEEPADDAGSEPGDAGTQPLPGTGGAGGAAGRAGGSGRAGSTGSTGSTGHEPPDASMHADPDATAAMPDATPPDRDRDSATSGRTGDDTRPARPAAEPDAATGRDGGRQDTVTVRGGGCACSIENPTPRAGSAALGAWGLLAVCAGRSLRRRARAMATKPRSARHQRSLPSASSYE